MQRKSSRVLVVSVIVLIICGCTGSGEPAPPEARAGLWKGSAQCGEISFEVNPDGKTIFRIEFTKIGRQNKSSYSLENRSGGWPINEDGEFNLDTLELLDNIIFYGQFSQDAKKATGTWVTQSSCSSDWEVTKSR